GSAGSAGPVLAAVAHRPQAERDASGALCPRSILVWNLSAGSGNGRIGLAGSCATHTDATDAISASHLHLHDPDCGLLFGQVPAAMQHTSVGDFPGRDQYRDVHSSTSALQCQRASGTPGHAAEQSVAAIFCLDSQ